MPAARLESCSGDAGAVSDDDAVSDSDEEKRHSFAEPAIRFRIELVANCEYNFHISISKLRMKDLSWLVSGKDCKRYILAGQGEFDPVITFEVNSGRFIIRINFPDDGNFISQKFEMPYRAALQSLEAAKEMLRAAGQDEQD